jgi:hypothetical protein
MKRILLVFSLSILLLADSLYFGAVESAVGQEHTVDRINFGSRWNSWPDEFRLIYLLGFRDGESRTYFYFVDCCLRGKILEPYRKATG